MQIAKNRVVSFHYTLRDEQGALLDSTDGREPVWYLHGKGGMVPGLERALEGRSAGDRFEVTVPPEEGYGPRQDALVQIVPRAKFAEGADLTPGTQLRATGPQGARIVTVVRAERDFVTVDANHPLAGRTLRFDVEVADVRRATQEEIAHGHAHGPGGHRH